jgi:hypothetical protein
LLFVADADVDADDSELADSDSLSGEPDRFTLRRLRGRPFSLGAEKKRKMVRAIQVDISLD